MHTLLDRRLTNFDSVGQLLPSVRTMYVGCKRVVDRYQPGLACLLSFVLIVLSPTAQATEFELSRIATELNFASSQLAQELKYSRNFGGLGRRADRLARESSQLVDAIRRNRSASYIRSQFDDVNRRYVDLEDSFLRAYRNNSDAYVFEQVGFISNLFSDLESTFYFTRYYVRQPRVYTFVPPLAVRNYDIPPVFYGGRLDTRSRSDQDHRDRERYSVPRGNRSTHEERVIQRRNQIADQHRESQRRIRQGRTSRTETRRRNHYD